MKNVVIYIGSGYDIRIYEQQYELYYKGLKPKTKSYYITLQCGACDSPLVQVSINIFLHVLLLKKESVKLRHKSS